MTSVSKTDVINFFTEKTELSMREVRSKLKTIDGINDLLGYTVDLVCKKLSAKEEDYIGYVQNYLVDMGGGVRA
ncbi:MAG: hypothetical protein FWB96_01270 [Defluviitaleaceae bacterium]|nr:hypothetical protein [Defluviitaleaceae bacterium]MCL2261677.1 hypothetical protein [Defluviitaleaceae bacterium]